MKPQFSQKPLTNLPSNQIAIASLDRKSATPFLLQPDSTVLEELANEIDAIKVHRLRFEGEISSVGRDDWQLAGRCKALVSQRCVVSLTSVNCRIDKVVERRFTRDLPMLAASTDGEVPVDDSIEVMPVAIGLLEIARETLLLELPDYPRKPGLKTVNVNAGVDTKEIKVDDTKNVFAVLQQLKNSSEPT